DALPIGWLDRTPDKREGGSSSLPRPTRFVAGWSSPVARWAHNPKVAGSNPVPATNFYWIWESDRSDPRPVRGCSSVGRAPDLHSGGRRFDSCHLHQKFPATWSWVAASKFDPPRSGS